MYLYINMTFMDLCKGLFYNMHFWCQADYVCLAWHYSSSAEDKAKAFMQRYAWTIPPQSCFYVSISSERIWKPGFYTKQESNLLSSTPPPAELLYTHHHAFLDQNWYELNTTINCMETCSPTYYPNCTPGCLYTCMYRTYSCLALHVVQ